MSFPRFAAQCRSCHAPIAWVETEAGRRMPIDPPRRDDAGAWVGNVWVEPNGSRLVACAVGKNPAFKQPPGATLYTSHFATCPNAAAHRAPRVRHDDLEPPIHLDQRPKKENK